VPTVQACGEGEATAAALDAAGLADGCVTLDADALLFGARRVYKELSLLVGLRLGGWAGRLVVWGGWKRAGSVGRRAVGLDSWSVGLDVVVGKGWLEGQGLMVRVGSCWGLGLDA
jgi:hypothetical protein